MCGRDWSSDVCSSDLERVKQNLQKHYPTVAVINSALETIWEAIAQEDNWQPFETFLQQLDHSH